METFMSISVLLIIGAAVFFATRSLRKKRKSGGGCGGNCAACGRCGNQLH